MMCYELDKWSTRWVKYWLMDHTQRVVINGSFFKLAACYE